VVSYLTALPLFENFKHKFQVTRQVNTTSAWLTTLMSTEYNKQPKIAHIITEKYLLKAISPLETKPLASIATSQNSVLIAN